MPATEFCINIWMFRRNCEKREFLAPLVSRRADQQKHHSRSIRPAIIFNIFMMAMPFPSESMDHAHDVNGCPNPRKDGGRGSSAHAGSP